jgi:hypothetical protein
MCGAALRIEHTGGFARRVQTTSKLIKLLSNGSTLTAQNMPEATNPAGRTALPCQPPCFSFILVGVPAALPAGVGDFVGCAVVVR